ncbi:MAG TPA: ribonuclease HII [Solirubrobacterales bacterium]|nr:ribonuclease HII [Solirubrobacterales bacterium]
MASKKSIPDPAGLFAHDRELGSAFVAGADEAGRGCLAGPIVAAAVSFDRRCLEDLGGGLLNDLNDSKRMTAKARERLYPVVMRCAAKVCVVMRSSRYIDANGLHVSNKECLGRALAGLDVEPGTICLVDGFFLPECPVEHRRLVKGDSTSAAVAAASVVAKVTRDRCMTRAGALYPAYGFEGHKGYASAAHRDAIVEHGPSPIHRLSFASEAYGELGRAA